MRIHKTVVALLGVATLGITLAGCEERNSPVDVKTEVSGNVGGETNKIIAKDDDTGTIPLTSEHTVNFNGQSFKVIATYKLPSNRKNTWLFTATSPVYLSVKTENKPDNLKVVLNNVYSDVSILSKKSGYNGVRQDSTNQSFTTLSNDGGYTIDNNNGYSLPFQVEGINQNETSVWLINYGSGVTVGDTHDERVDEEDIGENAVAGQLKTVWTLSIKDGNSMYEKALSDSVGLNYTYGH